LNKIFKIRGTPASDEWPGITELAGYKNDFHLYKQEDLGNYVPGLSPEGLDLMEKMLVHNPNQRISAKEAMKHPYLADVPDVIKNMKWLNCIER